MAQHASPKVIGHTLDCLAQFMACSSVVVMTFSSNRPSIHVMIVSYVPNSQLFWPRKSPSTVARSIHNSINSAARCAAPHEGRLARLKLTCLKLARRQFTCLATHLSGTRSTNVH